MNDGSSSFAHHEMMLAQKLRYFSGPPFQSYTARIGICDFPCGPVETAQVSAEHDGKLRRRVTILENGTCRWGQGGFSGSRKEKDPEGIGRTGFGEGIESVKDGVYRKTSIDNLVLGQLLLNEGFSRVVVGDKPEIGWGFPPGGIYIDGVCDDCNHRSSWSPGPDVAFGEIWVEREGGDNHIGVESLHALNECPLYPTHVGRALSGEVPALNVVVDLLPGARVVGGNVAVTAAQDVVEAGRSFVGRVDDDRLSLAFQCFRESTGGGIVSVSKPRGGDENAGVVRESHEKRL